MERLRIRLVFCVALLAALPAAARAERPLLDVFADCEARALGARDVFAAYGPTADPTDAAISYAEVQTNQGLVTVKMFDDMPVCWVYGTKFTDAGRRTTVAHAAVYDQVIAHFTARASAPITLQVVEGIGGSVQFCEGDTVTLRLSFSSGGTDDAERSFGFQANAARYTSSHCP